jgi:pyruvate dehydrogenase E2 component (dihydrolipoamide acetyltransferase)
VSTSVKLPQWGMSMSEGTVAEWLVAEGDTVEVDQELVEVEAAKVTNTIPSPVAGTVGPLLIPEGETVEINTVLVEIYAKGEAPTGGGSTAGAGGGSAGTADAAQLPNEEAAETRPTSLAPDTEVEVPPQVPESEAARAATASSGDRGPRDAEAARSASGRVTGVVPLARKLARENGIDLRSVTGTGTNGRIVAKDVEAAIARASTPEAQPAPSGAEARPASTRTPATTAAPGAVPGQARSLSSMRRVIGERMTASLRDSAQLTLSTTADVTDFAQLRASVGAGAKKPGYVDAVIRACALALRDHPGVNAYLDGDSVVSAEAVHIGMAVAVDDGLVVPVIRDADRLGLADVGGRVRELAEAARAGSLSPDDYSGGTFSVTSLGGQGIDAFTPILNPPESAILGIGRSREVPLRFGDGIAWRQEMTLSLTIDHRIVDGYPGALFLQDVVRYLESPRELV